MLYCFQVWVNRADQERDRKKRGCYVRFYSQNLLDKGRPFCDVRFALGCRLIEHLRGKGHTVIRV
jgi:hypothetical protein